MVVIPVFGISPGRWLENWVKRHHPPAREAMTLDRRRIYILPTRFGYAYALMLLVMLLWSINYNNNLGFVLTFLLAALGVMAMWQAHANLLGLRIHPPHAEPVFAGQTARLIFWVDNPSSQVRYDLTLESNSAASQADLSAQGGAELSLDLPARHRGWLGAGRVRVHTTFPMGLFRAWSWVEFQPSCLVYPRPGGHRPLPQPALAAAAERGLAGTGGEDFNGLRAYRPGDSPRHVAWKAAARSDSLLVKRFSGQARPELWLDWGELEPDAPEARLAQLCRWVLLAGDQGLNYGLRLPGIDYPPDASSGQRRACLEALALHGLEDRP